MVKHDQHPMNDFYKKKIIIVQNGIKNDHNVIIKRIKKGY